MKEINLLKEYCNLDEKFKNLEKESVTVAQSKIGQYLCIRLDGIGLSKKYLKDVLKDNKFTNLMWQSAEDTYEELHRKTSTKAKNIFLAGIISSDEISFILNSQNNHYRSRLIKIATSLASTFSSFFTKNGLTAHKEDRPIIGAFDGRPIILSELKEVSEYIAYRYAIYIRNANSKLLRLAGVSDDELYSEENKNNIDFYQRKINALNIQEKSDSIANDPIVFVPNTSRKIDKFRFKSLSELLEKAPSKINKFDSWVNQKCIS